MRIKRYIQNNIYLLIFFTYINFILYIICILFCFILFYSVNITLGIINTINTINTIALHNINFKVYFLTIQSNLIINMIKLCLFDIKLLYELKKRLKIDIKQNQGVGKHPHGGNAAQCVLYIPAHS